ncbi:MAG TPA: MaoC family dehydratase [Acidimicrobiia bacterium]|nr:MaoC family dehydratase [Acidimicrobiia bacterium]
MTVEGLRVAVGDEVGVGDWVTIDQSRIDRFADVTEDHQWIHQAGDAADAGPFGGPIAHGYLTLSLLPRLLRGFPPAVDGVRMSINYGLDKLRFITPVEAGSRVRARAVLLAADPTGDGGIQLKYGTTIEIEGEERPAAYVEGLVRVYR